MCCSAILASLAAAMAICIASPASAAPLSYAKGQDGDAFATSPAPFPECPACTYQGSSGDCVPSPNSSCSVATATCEDGSCSHSQHRSVTCSSHGGVSQWCPCGSASAQSGVFPDTGTKVNETLRLQDLIPFAHQDISRV